MEIIFLLVGFALVAVGVAIIVFEVRSRHGTEAVNAQIIGFSNGRSNLNSFSFHSVAEYIGPNGRQYYVEASVGSSTPLHAVGDSVTVLVSPTEPEKAVIQSRLSFIMGGILTLMGMAGVIAFWATFRASIISFATAAFVIGWLALKIKTIWRKTPLSLQAWDAYKKQALSSRVFDSKEKISWADPASLAASAKHYEISNRFAMPTLILLGTVLLSASYYVYGKTESFLQHANRSSGRVVDFKTVDPIDDGSTTYAAVVEYTDHAGRRHKVVDSFSSSPPSYERGQAVTILYNRDNPPDARVDRGRWNHWLSLLLGSLGALFTALGLRSLTRS